MIKKALYMAALSASQYNAVFRVYYGKLIAKGKSQRLH